MCSIVYRQEVKRTVNLFNLFIGERLRAHIVVEMISYLNGFGMDCRQSGDVIEIRRAEKGWLSCSNILERILVAGSGGEVALIPAQTRAYLSLTAIPKPLRERLSAARILWADIESRERADYGNDLGEELMQFLRRYGVRFYRVPV